MTKTYIESIPEWTPEELVFNATAWKHGYRFFRCSRDLSETMRRPKRFNSEYIWCRTSLQGYGLTSDIDEIIGQNPKLKQKK